MVGKIVGFAVGLVVSAATIGVVIYLGNMAVQKISPGTRAIGEWGT